MSFDERIALTVADATRASGLGKSTLYEAMQAGALPYLKVGARRLIKREDLERFLENHRVGQEV